VSIQSGIRGRPKIEIHRLKDVCSPVTFRLRHLHERIGRGMRVPAVVALTPLFLFACADAPPISPEAYASAGAVGKATLLSSSGNGFFMYANEACDSKSRITDKWADIAKGVPTATAVTAGRPIFVGKLFDTSGLPFSSKCLSTGSFTPIAGETYYLGLRFEPNACSLVVMRVTGTDTREPESTLKLFRPGPRC
jgi:hypothetical protein